MKMLNNMGNASSVVKHDGTYYSNSWIIDIGFSHYMLVNKSLFNNLRVVPFFLVCLMNGELDITTQVGTVILSDTLQLSNVNKLLF